MATRDVPTFEGTPTLTEQKLAALKDWLAISMGDEDKAGTIEDANYYEGWSEALQAVLRLLYSVEGEGDD